LQHPGKFIYHLTKTHPTEDCFVKKACANASSTSSQSVSDITGPRGHLRNIKEEDVDEDVTPEDQVDCEDTNNDTNNEVLNYFARVSNHYLHLVKSSNSTNVTSRHTMLHPVILDSGANYHMFREREFFECIHPASGRVILGDGLTTLNIQGIGTVCCKLGNNTSLIEGVRFIPDLAESIYSLFLHIRLPVHSITSSFDEGLFVHFPSFTTKAIIGSSDIYLDATPYYDDTDSRKVISVPGSSLYRFRCDLKNFQPTILQESSNLEKDTLLLRNIVDPDVVTTDISSVTVLIVRCIDKASTSLLNRITFTEDLLRSSVGFRRVGTMKQHLSSLYQHTVTLDHTPPDAMLDIFATFPKTPRNTTPVPVLHVLETSCMLILFSAQILQLVMSITAYFSVTVIAACPTCIHSRI
jgi:hypothetical protein